jgi:adhesin/invasin
LGLSGSVGTYTLTFTVGSVSSGASNPIALAAGAAATVAANSATTQSATVGTAVSAAPSVKITDGAGNPVAGFAVGFAVTAGGGTVAPATVSSDAAGVASASSWILGPTAGTNNNTVQATASGLTGSPVIFTASGIAGPAAQLTYVTQPSTSAQSGVAFAQQPVLLLGDASNNPVAGTVVTATVSPASASLIGTTTATTDAAGHATFTNLGITAATGNYTLTFTAGAVTSPASNVIALSAPATNLFITTQPPSNATDNTQFSPQPVIQLRDAANNFVGPAGITITAALVPDVLCLGTLTGGKTATTDASGAASFASLKINITAPSSCRIEFTAPGLAAAVSNSILVSF